MIVCGGENLVDVIEMGDEQQGRVFHAVPGGSPYNCTRALGRLGMPTGYLTPISSDRFGDDLLAGLVADQVRHLGARPDAPTSLAMVTLSDGQPDYRFYRNGTAERMVTPEVLRATMPDQAEAFHIGSLALCTGKDAAAWSDLFIDSAQRGIFTSFDPNIRPLLAEEDARGYRARLDKMASVANLLRLSDEDLAWWRPDQTVLDALAELVALAPNALVVLTQGAEPVLCHWPGGQIEVPLTPVADLVDTVGAGDTLMAALLAGLHRKGALVPKQIATLPGATLHQIIRDASKAAAITCTRTGCNPPYARDVWP
ncbi:carbohydrate kinase family protein [Roseinatronobacter monicus]|uniref:carbohydrate kinase family protein n=1 Tax=Roseinatronobacter monicus TaxID=393481 RepID=UPI003F36B8A9